MTIINNNNNNNNNNTITLVILMGISYLCYHSSHDTNTQPTIHFFSCAKFVRVGGPSGKSGF